MIKYFSLVLVVILTSCAVPNYYQLYKTNFEGGKIDNNKIVFEDNNCRISYNFWNSGGDVGFSIYNKTDTDITINLTKTFFVLNGVAYEYFQNRVYSNSSSIATSLSSYRFSNYRYSNQTSSSSAALSSSYGTAFNEKPELTIPPKTLISISEFTVVESRYVNCGLTKFPTRRDIKTISFDKKNSPFVFYNLITYSSKSDTIRLENNFYVSEITNLPESEVFTDVDTSICGRKIFPPTKAFKNETADRFYIKYIN